MEHNTLESDASYTASSANYPLCTPLANVTSLMQVVIRQMYTTPPAFPYLFCSTNLRPHDPLSYPSAHAYLKHEPAVSSKLFVPILIETK